MACKRIAFLDRRAEEIRKSLEAAKISPDRVQKYLEDMVAWQRLGFEAVS